MSIAKKSSNDTVLEKDKPLRQVKGIKFEDNQNNFNVALRIDLKDVYKMGKKGFSIQQVADFFGYSWSYFRDVILKKRPDVERALRRGRLDRLSEVSDALYSSATEDHNVTAQIFWLKAQGGWSDKQEVSVNVKNADSLKNMSENELYELLMKLKNAENIQNDTEDSNMPEIIGDIPSEK